MKPQAVMIHLKQTVDVKNQLNALGLKYQETKDEYDVIVDDIPYEITRGDYQDPDVELCEHYGLDYDQVNCIEAIY